MQGDIVINTLLFLGISAVFLRSINNVSESLADLYLNEWTGVVNLVIEPAVKPYPTVMVVPEIALLESNGILSNHPIVF